MSEVEDKIQLGDYVGAYIAIRNQRDTLKRKFEAEDVGLKEELKKLEAVMLQECNNMNAIKTLRENFVCSDWDGLKSFIMENNLVELLQQRLHNGNLKEYLISHGEDGLPPGINSMREYSIVVKKPTNKA
jgi:hypothetical protein